MISLLLRPFPQYDLAPKAAILRCKIHPMKQVWKAHQPAWAGYQSICII